MMAGLLAFRWQRLPVFPTNRDNSGKGEAASDSLTLGQRIRITVAGTALVSHEIPF